MIEGSNCPELIVAVPGIEKSDAGGGDDVAIGALVLDGGGGDDTIYANGAAETTGGADDDVIYGDAVPELGTDAAEPLEGALMPFVEELGVKASKRQSSRAVPRRLRHAAPESAGRSLPATRSCLRTR